MAENAFSFSLVDGFTLCKIGRGRGKRVLHSLDRCHLVGRDSWFYDDPLYSISDVT